MTLKTLNFLKYLYKNVKQLFLNKPLIEFVKKKSWMIIIQKKFERLKIS